MEFLNTEGDISIELNYGKQEKETEKGRKRSRVITDNSLRCQDEDMMRQRDEEEGEELDRLSNAVTQEEENSSILKENTEKMENQLAKLTARVKELESCLEQKVRFKASEPQGVLEIMEALQFSRSFQKECHDEPHLIFFLQRAYTRYALSNNDSKNFCLSITFFSSNDGDEDEEDRDRFALRVRFEAGAKLDLVERGEPNVRNIHVGSEYNEYKILLKKAANRFGITKKALLVIIAHCVELLPGGCQKELLRKYNSCTTVLGCARIKASLNK